MLEVNDFSAVRISLASPEQIRSWSYGEVTKPETINYRTQKPEKDGLFCEKIFGPTKDFECYCGKYKRMRYKGIVCDKCGVEVARSKVRRVRMGHIELAAPVSHIWFAKGTPSRIGLLRDLSPRSLEQILYYVKYLVLTVDEEARQRAKERFDQEHLGDIVRQEKATEDKILEIETSLEQEIARIKAEEQEAVQRLEQERLAAIKNITEQSSALRERLTRSLDATSPEDVILDDKVIVSQGETVEKRHLELLLEETQRRVTETEAQSKQQVESRIEQTNAEIEHRQTAATEEENNLRNKLAEGKTELDTEYRQQIEDLESLHPGVLLAELKLRDMRAKYGEVFTAGTGAEAILNALKSLDLNVMSEEMKKEIASSSGQRRKKAIKRLRAVEAFRRSGNKPEWMILTVLPVLPPDLRPMVQLDGGRFATSDLNDLYRRVINRNNRLRRLLELGAPEIIINNEKRMLQEAVDSLIDNGRRGRPVSTGNNHRLKSLSDMLRGKQGRFRQNLLGKRVDYSARSVIVVGPELKLHQCGLPKRMALELFKPFVMHELVVRGLAHNIRSAKRIVERLKPEVWDILEDVVKDRPVLLNRAPTLHRLGIQAFQPVLIDGSAIQIHPLVCTAFNADFDGDQMAVHVPLSRAAVAEAKQVMLSIYNMLSPSSGDPLVAPTLDMVLGCFYLTSLEPGAKGEGMSFGSFEEAILVYNLGAVALRAEVEVRDTRTGKRLKTSVGRIIFNEKLPPELGFQNKLMEKKALKQVVAECYRAMSNEATATVVDNIKRLGFEYATKSGTTIAINDIEVPKDKVRLLEETDRKIADIQEQFQRGLVTEDERYSSTVKAWTEATDAMTTMIEKSLSRYSSISMMATSGAKGNIAQIRQMAGMRGLMSDPSGRIIELPIRSSFREGLSVLEYFISTHGARKGLADTALRTADSGYLTRRLVDVSQEVIVLEEDCGTTAGVWIKEPPDKVLVAPLAERITGRWVADKIVHPETGETIVERNQEIDENKAQEIVAAGITRVYVRSGMSCQAKRGVCRLCYGRSIARGRLVSIGEAVGIVAAQSIGEPGTQLTMRTFHTGGVYEAGLDITSGLPRVEELFEARSPKGQAIISEIPGRAEILHTEVEPKIVGRKIKVVSSEIYRDEYPLPPGYQPVVSNDQVVDTGTVLAEPPQPAPSEASGQELAAVTAPITARVEGRVVIDDHQIVILHEEREEREYPVAPAARILVENGARVRMGEQLTEGSINPQDILRVNGRDAVQEYLMSEVQKVYRAQGVNINDKHIETIIRQMLRKVRVDSPGDTRLLPGDLVDRFLYEDINHTIMAEGGEPATAQPVLLGVTKASLNTDSFLAAASFQETTRVLTEAAVTGSIDRLRGLKENVIIGKLIPARAQITVEPVSALSAPLRFLKGLTLPEELGKELQSEPVAEYEEEHLEEPAADYEGESAEEA